MKASRVRDEGLERHALPSPFLYLMEVGAHEAGDRDLHNDLVRPHCSTADLQDEGAELPEGYRCCLTEYQDEPPEDKEICGRDTQSL